MQAESRTLAQRHMWLSWWWGMGLVWAGAVVWMLVWVVEKASVSDSLPSILGYIRRSLGWGVLGSLLFLGAPALLGALVRRPLMRWAFAALPSRRLLLLRTTLVFVGSIGGLMLLYMRGGFLLSPDYRVEPVVTTQLFFGLSLPWLLSSLAAAWWVTRPVVRHQPN